MSNLRPSTSTGEVIRGSPELHSRETRYLAAFFGQARVMGAVYQDMIHQLDIAETVFLSVDDWRYTVLDLSPDSHEVDSDSLLQLTVNYSTLVIQ